jgi:hypothetical protein
MLIGDFEESNFKKNNPSIVNFSRFLISSDGNIKSTIFHLKIGDASFKTIEYLTEFINGTILLTSNNILSTKIEYPNKIIFLFHETDSPEVLLIMHQSEIQKYVDKKDFEIQKINNIDEIIDQKKRIKKIENHFRQTITKDDILKELSRLCVGIKNVQTLSRIADRIIELRMS